MKLIVGLGNPGNNFSLTKHNFGFWIIDKLVEQRSLKFKAGKGDYVFAKDHQYIFMKPTTFMNNSGVALTQIINYYNIANKDIVVVYDDLDINLGNIRFKCSGTDGGHNGIKSIIYHLKTDVFDRLKIGIASDTDMRPAEKYVLEPFQKKYTKSVNQVTNDAVHGIDYYLQHGINKTMNNFNKRNVDNGK
tara:strand:+ start:116 stop:685 length:570 start_codon:yes stop_codon:yes gene_type:complete